MLGDNAKTSLQIFGCWLFALLSRTDARAVGNHLGQEGSGLHAVLWLVSLLACVDARVVGNHLGQEASGLQDP